jgi:uncharacterized protein
MNQPVRVTSFADFERRFGGLHSISEAAYAIQQYYLNGGSIAWVVRVASGNPQPAVIELEGGSPPDGVLRIEAASPGQWGVNLQVATGAVADRPDLFNVVVRELAQSGGRTVVASSEVHRNLSMDQASPRYVKDAINAASDLVVVTTVGMGNLPAPTGPTVPDPTVPSVVSDPKSPAFLSLGDDPSDPAKVVSDGTEPDAAALLSGMNTLDKIDPFIFNILCLPTAAKLDQGSMVSVYSQAEAFCEANRAFLIVDLPATVDSQDHVLTSWLPNVGDLLRNKNAAVYFPRLEIADAVNENRPRNVGASGTLAGVFARTDSTRGVWKAPAGTDASLRGASLTVALNDFENGGLNPLGVNVLRNFPIFGNVSWGARTLDGADQAASEWKYIPVRRTALFIEESLYQGLKWVVFEPNDEPLWAQIRLNVGAFMQNLFRQGAFQGTTPREAYFVKCDKETTTQNDIDRGIVNIHVGFAPLKPAEFVVIRIQQIAGQIAT